MYGALPPVPKAVAVPFEPPLQLTEELELMVAVTALGCEILTEVVAEQLLASNTVTV